MKVLFILSRFPFPLIKGDKLRAYHQIKELSKSCDIYLCALSDKDIPKESIEALKPYCKEIHTFKLNVFSIAISIAKHFFFSKKPIQVGYFFNQKISKKIKEISAQIKPNHIFCQLIRTAEYAKQIEDIPKTLDYMDALSAGMTRREDNALKITRYLFKMEAQRLKKYEHEVYQYFDHCCVISKSDRDLIFHYNNEDIEILPNGIDASYFQDQKMEKVYDLLFTGNMSYPPNVQSAKYLIEEIMPLIWQANPDITLLVSGANPDKSIVKLKSKKVNIQGWVDDIRTSYSISKIFIAPMLIGSGMQNKLLEAMAMRMPCITSSLANRALEAEENTEILVGHNKQEYANHVLHLIGNNEKANEIAEKGHKFVTDRFNWSKSNHILLNILNTSNGESPS